MSTTPITRRHHPRSLVVAMFLQFGLGGAVLPFISLLFRDRGLDFTQVSYIFSGSSAMLLFFPFFWGMLADRFIPLNRIFTLLNLLMIGCLTALGAQRTFAGLMTCFLLFYACLNPSFVLLNPLSFHFLERPRQQFGRLRAWGSIGWIVPSVLIYGWLALNPAHQLDFTIHLGIGVSAAMAIASFWLPHVEPGAIHVGPAHEPGLGYVESVRRLLANRSYVVVLVIYAVVASSFAIQAIYSAPLLEDAGLARKWIGPSQCIGVVLEIILFNWRFKLLERMPMPMTILIGVVAMIGRHMIFWLSDSVPLLVASHLLTGVVVVYHHIGVSVLVNAIAPREVKSTAQTLIILCGSGLGPMLANFGVGWITATRGQGLRPVFGFATTLAVIGGEILLINLRRLNVATRAH